MFPMEPTLRTEPTPPESMALLPGPPTLLTLSTTLVQLALHTDMAFHTQRRKLHSQDIVTTSSSMLASTELGRRPMTTSISLLLPVRFPCAFNVLGLHHFVAEDHHHTHETEEVQRVRDVDRHVHHVQVRPFLMLFSRYQSLIVVAVYSTTFNPS